MSRIGCGVCHQWVEDIGPWCRLYLENEYCWPLKMRRLLIMLHDSYGDGPYVDANCRNIREVVGDNYVP